MRCGQSIQNGQPNRKANTGLHDEVSDYGKAAHAETNGLTVTRCVVCSVVSSSLFKEYNQHTIAEHSGIEPNITQQCVTHKTLLQLGRRDYRSSGTELYLPTDN